VKVTTSVDHLTAQKQFGIIEHFAHGQFAVGIFIRQLNQVVSLELCMILIVWINVHLQQHKNQKTLPSTYSTKALEEFFKNCVNGAINCLIEH